MMKTYKYIGLIIIIPMLLIGCRSGKNLSNTHTLDAPFKLVSATYTSNEEIPNSLIVKIVIDNNNVMLDELYFKSQISKLKKEIEGSAEFYTTVSIGKGNRDFILHSDPAKEFGNTVLSKEKLPFDLEEDEAIISYMYKGKLEYFHIAKISRATE